MVRPASSRRTRCARASRRRWATTSRSSWTRSRSSAPCWPATTGAGAPPASSPRSGPSAHSAWSPPTATTSTTLPARLNRRRRSRSTGFGINTTFTPNGVAPDYRPIAASFVDCCGGCGRRIGGSMTRTYDRTAVSFDNPDFVEVVIHSYRHRFGYAGGDPSLEAIERRLAAKPPISVPTIVLHGDGSGLSPPENSLKHAAFFTGPYQRRVIPTAGHNLPQEAPNAFADAVLELVRATK